MNTEVTSEKVATIASKGLSDPSSLCDDEIKSVCASALTQARDKNKLDALEAAALHFVEKVDCGKAQSKDSYQRFKLALR